MSSPTKASSRLSLRANDDETLTSRKFSLEAQVKHRHGHAPHDIRKSFAADGPENEDGPRPALVSAPSAASPELEDRPRRRTFKAADKLRILREIDRVGPGGAGGILRREGALFVGADRLAAPT
jgi:hypothetical protein